MRRNATCHVDRPVEARGLCHACYVRARRLGLLGGFPTRFSAPAEGRKAYLRAWHERRKARIANLVDHSAQQ